jgi:hypothetical protein
MRQPCTYGPTGHGAAPSGRPSIGNRGGAVISQYPFSTSGAKNCAWHAHVRVYCCITQLACNQRMVRPHSPGSCTCAPSVGHSILPHIMPKYTVRPGGLATSAAWTARPGAKQGRRTRSATHDMGTRLVHHWQHRRSVTGLAVPTALQRLDVSGREGASLSTPSCANLTPWPTIVQPL